MVLFFLRSVIIAVYAGEGKDRSFVRDLLQAAAVVQLFVDERTPKAGEGYRPAEKQEPRFGLRPVHQQGG